MVDITAWPMAAEAYRILNRNKSEFLLQAGGWITCLIGSVAVKMLPWPYAISLLLNILTMVGVLAAVAAFSVGWCRAILQDERSSGNVTLAFGRREIRYFLYQSAIALIPGVPIALVFMVAGAETWWGAGFSFLQGGPFQPLSVLSLVGSLVALFAMFVAGVIVSARLMIVLPAVAMDEPGRLLGEAWRRTRGRASPLFQGWLACILPAIVLWEMPSFCLERALGSLAWPIIELMAYPLCFVAVALTGGFYSYAYAQLVEGGPVSDQYVPPAAARPREAPAVSSASNIVPVKSARLASRVSSILRKSGGSSKFRDFTAFRS